MLSSSFQIFILKIRIVKSKGHKNSPLEASNGEISRQVKKDSKRRRLCPFWSENAEFVRLTDNYLRLPLFFTSQYFDILAEKANLRSYFNIIKWYESTMIL